MPSMQEVSSAMQTQAGEDCDKKDNSADPCPNTDSSSNSNNRLYNTSLPMVKDTIVDYLLSGMTNNESVTIETNNENDYFLLCSYKE